MTEDRIRLIDDPVVLARAARIFRATLARERLTLADLTAADVEPSSLDTGVPAMDEAVGLT